MARRPERPAAAARASPTPSTPERFEQGLGAFSSQRYNYTTINSNLLDAENQSRTFDQLATVSTIAAGQSLRPWKHRDSRLLGARSHLAGQPRRQLHHCARDRVQGQSDRCQLDVSAIKAPSRPVRSRSASTSPPTRRSRPTTSSRGSRVPFRVWRPGRRRTCNGSAQFPPPPCPGNYYVGLLVDRQNQLIESVENDNGVAAANQTTVERNPLDPIVNGSFETGDLTGWTVKELTPASNPSLPLSVRGAGVEYPAPTFTRLPLLHRPRLLHQRAHGRQYGPCCTISTATTRRRPVRTNCQPAGVLSGHPACLRAPRRSSSITGRHGSCSGSDPRGIAPSSWKSSRLVADRLCSTGRPGRSEPDHRRRHRQPDLEAWATTRRPWST